MTSDLNKSFAVAHRPPVVKGSNAIPKGQSSVANLFILNGGNIRLALPPHPTLFFLIQMVCLSTYFQYQIIFHCQIYLTKFKVFYSSLTDS